MSRTTSSLRLRSTPRPRNARCCEGNEPMRTLPIWVALVALVSWLSPAYAGGGQTAPHQRPTLPPARATLTPQPTPPTATPRPQDHDEEDDDPSPTETLTPTPSLTETPTPEPTEAPTSTPSPTETLSLSPTPVSTSAPPMVRVLPRTGAEDRSPLTALALLAGLCLALGTAARLLVRQARPPNFQK